MRVLCFCKLGRIAWESDWVTVAALVRIAEITRGDAVRIVARQEVAPGLVVATASIPVLPTHWSGTDCGVSPSRVLGNEGSPPGWRIGQVILERDGTTRVLDPRCMGQNWPVSGTGECLPYHIGDETAARVAGGWLIGESADGAATYGVGWNLGTGEGQHITVTN